MTLMLNNLIGFGAGGVAPPATISFVGASSQSASQQVFTYTNHATGTAGNRWTIVGVIASDSATDFHTSSMTVGGASATELVDSANASLIQQSSLYIISNPSGTTATIEVTMSETVTDHAIIVWAAYDLLSATPHDTGSDANSSTPALDVSLNVPTDGIAVAVGGIRNSGSNATWSGMTERADGIVGVLTYSGADTTTVGTPLSASVDFAFSQDETAVSASFR